MIRVSRREVACRNSFLHGLFLASILLFPATAKAQFTTGTILGTVSDPSGAVIVGARVTATQLDTGFSRTAATDEAGS